MQHGFIKTAAVTPKIRVADAAFNAEKIISLMEEAAGNGAKIIVFPELCITGYTCGDLFLQQALLSEAKAQLLRIAERTRNLDALVLVGLPFEKAGKLYNVAAALSKGRVLALIPKATIPNYSEFYEARYFMPGGRKPEECSLGGVNVPFGTDILLESDAAEGLVLAVEICEDVWAADTPGTGHALAGATVLANLSASDETVGKSGYRNMLVTATSARLVCGYIYASAGEGESTQDMVFGGHNIIAENGTVLAESPRFAHGVTYGVLDIGRLRAERRRMTTFGGSGGGSYLRIPFSLRREETALERSISPSPFVPIDDDARRQRCEEILNIQSMGLKKRFEHTGCRSAVIGISGGLDSTLALLVTVRTFDMLFLPREKITAVTMPCFGTTDRTYENACRLSKELRVSLREIPIEQAVRQHFSDIGHEEACHDVTYENSQARERTQVLMDIANQTGGLVIGTGDMSELALGWATYNGDHMSMYGVNAGVPKTLVRHLVRYYADACGNKSIRSILLDVLDTPVSPELLPPEGGVISQKTEDLVGPYELHDFVLYYCMRFGFSPAKIYRLEQAAFAGRYEASEMLKWLRVFYRRFFSQQFKRSCLPDGPKVGSVALSPRGDWRMPSDAAAALWLRQVEELTC